MIKSNGSRRRLVAPNLLALTSGIVSSSVLVSAYTYVSGHHAADAAHVDGSKLLVPVDMQWQLALWISTFYAVVIAAVCIPIWLLLTKLGLNRAPVAVALGFIATMTSWVLINLNGHASIADLLSSGLPYAVCGAVAGLITWLCRPRMVRS